MTNESISGFLNSIAEAKRAFDAEPDYQRQIRDLERDKQRLGEVVAARELRIHELKSEATTLTQALRSAEVERDDAGFRALEEADRVQGLLTLVRQYVGDGLKAISAVEGRESIIVNKVDHDDDMTTIRKQEEEIVGLQQACDRLQNDMRLAQEQLTRPFAPGQTEGISSSQGDTTDRWSRDKLTQEAEAHIAEHGEGTIRSGEGQRVEDPTAQHSTGTESQNAASSVANTPNDASMPEGQSDGPFASSATTGSTPEPVIVSSTSAESETSAVSSASQTQPERNRDRSTFFTGRRYYDVTYFVPLHQWLNEGGTEADYHWRPASEANQFNRASHQS